jgi:hypothetical protein
MAPLDATWNDYSVQATPTPLDVKIATIPEELKRMHRWVVFRFEGERKIPHIPGTTCRAACDNAKTWRSFADALRDVERGDGYLGFAIDESLGMTFLDVDDVYLANGELDLRVKRAVDALNTYTEISVSGQGIHTLSWGLPPERATEEIEGKKVEVYGRTPRFILITGDCRPGLGADDNQIAERPYQVADLLPSRPRSTRARSRSIMQGTLPPLNLREVDMIVSLLAPEWRAGDRHDLALRLSGWLAKSHVSREQADDIIERLAADDPELDDRLTAVADTYEKHASGAVVLGFTGIGDIIDPATRSRVAQILDAHEARCVESRAAPVSVSAEAQERSRSIQAPTFPIAILPPDLREYVEAAARSLPVPPEMVAVPMLAYVGSLIGDRMHIVVKDGYSEYPIVYTFIVASPGAAKTPALAKAQWPLDALQDDEMKRHRAAFAQYEADYAAWKSTKPKERGPEPQQPRLRSYLSTNLTIEWLIGELEHSPGISISSDEILSWFKGMNKYQNGRGSDRQEFLSLWSGRTIKCDRKGGGTTYRRFPVASVVGGIQPDRVSDLYSAGQGTDGFIERFLPLVLECDPAYWNEAKLDSSLYAKAVSLFRALDQLPFTGSGGHDGSTPGIPVRMHPDARRLWTTWYNDNVDQIRATRGIAQGFYRKLPAYVARFALILHALWYPTWRPLEAYPPISAECMQGAIDLAEFFRAHIRRFLAMLNVAAPVTTDSLPPRIERYLHIEGAQSNGGWVSRSTVMKRLRVGRDDLNHALDAMRQAGSIEVRHRSTGKSPVEEWRLVVDGAQRGQKDHP